MGRLYTKDGSTSKTGVYTKDGSTPKTGLHQRRGQAPSTGSFSDRFLNNSPSISAAQYAHPQAVIFEVAEAIRSPLNQLHFVRESPQVCARGLWTPMLPTHGGKVKSTASDARIESHA